MNKQEAIIKLQNILNDDIYGWTGDIEKAFKMAIESLQKSAYLEQWWIPVTEKLPDVAQRVLLSGHGQVMIGMLHSFGKYSLEPTGISYVYPKDDIEAWMPLPESYQKGDV